MSNKIICVDFDGVIHSYRSGWKGVAIITDPPVPGAIKWLMEHLPVPESISAMGPVYNGPIVQVYSSRSKSWFGRRAMKKWLIKHGLHPAYIREGILKFPSKKPAAFLTIDDRAICFDGSFPTTEEMLQFKPWYYQKVGATGNFPDGKINSDDEGELRLAVAHDRDFVHLQFGKRIAWLSFTAEQGKQFAQLILEHSNAIK